MKTIINKVIQIGNLIKVKNRDNPQRGRIYSVSGLAPAIYMYNGGGLQPLLVELVKDDKNYVV